MAVSVAVPGIPFRRFLENVRTVAGSRHVRPVSTGGGGIPLPPEVSRDAVAGQGVSGVAIPEQFDRGSMAFKRVFLYFIGFTVIFLFQIHNTLTIRELSRKNEKLRERLRMVNSVGTGLRLKMNELQSIHKIADQAASLGLSPSSEPPVELDSGVMDKGHR